MYYRLEARTPVPTDRNGFAEVIDPARSDDRRVAFDTIAPGLDVSTVFLGLDHSIGGGPPLLFETMVFRDGEGGDQWRYCTWDEAEAGHRRVCDELRARPRRAPGNA